MLYLLRQRNFGLLWFGGLISYIGNWITLVALPVYIYTLTGSYLATGATWMAFMLPSVVLGSVAGVYVDRWDRRVTMLVTNLLDVPLTLALLFVHSADQLWLVYLVTLLRSTASNFMSPAEGALLPKLVGDEHLPTANALNTLNDNLARLIGPAIGGAVLAYLGFSYAVLLDAVSFAVAAALIALIRAPRSITRAVVAEEAHDKPPNIWREWLEGLRLVRGSRLISLLFVLAGISMLSEGFFEVVIIPF
ncbi:MAG: MFS transporter, partial [Chloroflexia bacterium]